jgi:hypothetical protein
MSKHQFDYSRINVDERLLMFLPHYKALWCRKNPQLAHQVNDQAARNALLQSLEAAGHATRTKACDGQIWLVPTAAFLVSTQVKPP